MIKVTPNIETRFSVPARQKVHLLYNQVNELVKKQKISATFCENSIELSPSTQPQSENIIKKLMEIGAKFTMKRTY